MTTSTIYKTDQFLIFKPKAELWLLEGKKRFAETGISGINIDNMSRSLGVAKSSFYYLFKSKEQFLIELYRYWDYHGTRKVIDAVDLIEDPLSRLKTLTRMVFDNVENDRFLLQLLTLAEFDSGAQAILDQVNTKRQNYLTVLFRELGFNERDAAHNTRIYLTYYFGICIQIKLQSLNKIDRHVIVKDIQDILDIKFE